MVNKRRRTVVSLSPASPDRAADPPVTTAPLTVVTTVTSGAHVAGTSTIDTTPVAANARPAAVDIPAGDSSPSSPARSQRSSFDDMEVVEGSAKRKATRSSSSSSASSSCDSVRSARTTTTGTSRHSAPQTASSSRKKMLKRAARPSPAAGPSSSGDETPTPLAAGNVQYVTTSAPAADFTKSAPV